MEKITFGEILKERIKELKLTQNEFADKIEISLSALKQYINNKSKPDIETLEKIAKELYCTYDYLLGKSNTPIKECYDDIKALTGLSDKAILNLNKLHNKVKHSNSRNLTHYERQLTKLVLETPYNESFEDIDAAISQLQLASIDYLLSNYNENDFLLNLGIYLFGELGNKEHKDTAKLNPTITREYVLSKIIYQLGIMKAD